MQALLLLIAAVCLLGTSFIFIPVTWIVGIFSKKAERDIASFYVVSWCRLARVLTTTKVQYEGMENLRKGETYLFICNHRSMADIVALYSRLPLPTGFIGKISLRRVPILNFWLKKMGGLFLNRDNVREGAKTILEGIDELKNGISLCVFPEGTRNRSANPVSLLDFHSGTFKLASKADVKVVPISLYYYNKPFSLKNIIPKPTKIRATFGMPIDIRSLPAENQKFIGPYMQNVIQEMLNRSKDEI